ncbi:MAG: GCN5-related N-acetyltransferase, partial [Phycisphaerales bacterium]|nr:GCN5-related N-acetyltransferase [Phycisphaerales bacterium]
MTIRPATAADVPAVLPLVSKVEAHHQRADPQKYTFRADPGTMYRGWLQRNTTDARAVFLVADAARAGEPPRVVGFLIGTIEKEVPIYVLTEYGWVHDLWVDEAYRHEGVGRQLVMQAVERFAALGAKQVRMDVLATNEPAKALFANCGFRPSVVEMLLEVNG